MLPLLGRRQDGNTNEMPLLDLGDLNVNAIPKQTGENPTQD